jgi:hypothetical protein
MNAGMNLSGSSIIKWQSSGTSTALRKEATTGGPMVIFGTKWPSMTSTCNRLPPPSIACLACAAKREKSAESTEGAICGKNTRLTKELLSILPFKTGDSRRLYGSLPGFTGSTNCSTWNNLRATTPDGPAAISPNIMHSLRAPGLLVLCLAFAAIAAALPMKRNVEQQLKDAAAPKVQYPAARVAWDGPDLPKRPFNPVYEAMLYRLSPEAQRAALLQVAVPAPAFLISIFGIIVLLRMMRRERERAIARRFENIVDMPSPTASEAA